MDPGQLAKLEQKLMAQQSDDIRQAHKVITSASRSGAWRILIQFLGIAAEYIDFEERLVRAKVSIARRFGKTGILRGNPVAARVFGGTGYLQVGLSIYFLSTHRALVAYPACVFSTSTR